jgi:hypothetical protein
MNQSPILRVGVVMAALLASGPALTACTDEERTSDPPAISGHVWEDRNGNGVEDSGEPRLAEVRVNLDCAGPFRPGAEAEPGVDDLNRCSSTETDERGEFGFRLGVPDDARLRIRVQFVAPSGYAFTVGGESDAKATGLTDDEVLPPVRVFNAGLVATGVTGGAATPPADDPEPAPADELCALHERRVAALDEIGPAVDPASFEAQTRATLTFYQDAAGILDEPEASAFRAMAEHFQALIAYHEPRDWNPDLTARIGEPLIPVEASGIVNTVLASRGCTTPPQGEG